MKTALVILLLACIGAPAFAFPCGPRLSSTPTSTLRETISKNLSDGNADIRMSTMQLVMELKETWPERDFDFAVIPLMSVLKNDDVPELRILAAMALNSFNSTIARYAVSRRALYDPDARVARRCGALARSWTAGTASSLVMEINQ